MMTQNIDEVVVDVEIQKTIEETSGGWDATDKLGVAVACVWEYATQRMRVYGPDDVETLKERLLRADRITGFNIFNFDFPVIWGIARDVWVDGYNGKLAKAMVEPKTNDLLRRIWKSLGLNPDKFENNPPPGKPAHAGWSLDKVAKATLGVSKIGYGGDAPKWYQAGQIQKVVNYCADDVALERDLSDFLDRYGYVIDPSTRQPLEVNP